MENGLCYNDTARYICCNYVVDQTSQLSVPSDVHDKLVSADSNLKWMRLNNV